MKYIYYHQHSIPIYGITIELMSKRMKEEKKKGHDLTITKTEWEECRALLYDSSYFWIFKVFHNKREKTELRKTWKRTYIFKKANIPKYNDFVICFLCQE